MAEQTQLGQAAPNLETTHRVYFRDSRYMHFKKPEVHLVVTSPPYWKIKDYGNDDQIGHRDSLKGYFRKLDRVWAGSIRALYRGCRLCINIGDQYLRATKSVPYQIVPLHAMLVNRISEHYPDDLLYLGSIIWQKVSSMSTTGGASVMGSYNYPRNGYVTYFNEYIAIFKRIGESQEPPQISDEIKQRSRIELVEWRNLFNATNWDFKGEPQKGGIAIFPEGLPNRLMRMFTYEGDTVLDPFLGSGTTTRVALDNHRSSIGYEIGYTAPDIDDYREVIKRKIRYYETSPDVRNKVFQFVT